MENVTTLNSLYLVIILNYNHNFKTTKQFFMHNALKKICFMELKYLCIKNCIRNKNCISNKSFFFVKANIKTYIFLKLFSTNINQMKFLRYYFSKHLTMKLV